MAFLLELNCNNRKQMRKKLFFTALVSMLIMLGSCSDNEPTGYETEVVYVLLEGELDNPEGIEVKLTDSRGGIYRQATDAAGVAVFGVPVGVYMVSVSHVSTAQGWRIVYNGAASNVVVRVGEEHRIELAVTESRTSAIVIRELYVGGCQKDDGSGWFNRDKYVIITNNSGEQVTLPGLCLALATPYNSYGQNKNYTVDGRLNYEDAGFIPAASSFWYFQGAVTFDPWEEKVVALNGAINHTLAYSGSVDLSCADYYCTYDIEQYTSTSYYPSPSELIPTSHYLKVVRYGDETETAWPLSATSPAFFIFTPSAGMTPLEFGMDAGNVWYDEGRALPTYACRKVPVENVLDGVEVFSATWDEAYKRLTSAVDVGYVYFTARQGHSVQRRVDESESQRQGHTVYIDTNNSSADFMERDHASLRDLK